MCKCHIILLFSRIRHNICTGAEEFLQCVSYLQGVDASKRETGAHIEYDSDDWKFVEKTLVNFDSVSSQLVRWCAKDKTILGSVTS